MKTVGIVIGCLVAGFFLLGMLGADRPTDPAQAIAEACQQQFASEGQQKVMDCKFQLMTRRLQESENAKLQRAYQQSR